jgi:hypothetical protein
MGGLQSQSGSGGDEKNSQPLPGLEPPIIQPVAQRYTAELSRFLRRVLVVQYLDKLKGFQLNPQLAVYKKRSENLISIRVQYNS